MTARRDGRPSTLLLLVQLGLVLAALTWLYAPVLLKLASDWQTDDNYSHGWFIPCIALFMVHASREKLRAVPARPANPGVLLVVAGLLMLVVARIGSELFLQRLSLLPVLLGLTAFLLGWGPARLVLAPIAFLIFMIPLPAILWNRIAFPLQLFASQLTEQFVRLLGIPIFREGNVLYLAQTTLEVVDACSGLRSLTTMCALAAALAWFSPGTPWRRWLLFLSAVPIAILVNIARLGGTAVLAQYYGEQVAQGFLHEFSGLLTFGLGIALLTGTSFLLTERGRRR